VDLVGPLCEKNIASQGMNNHF